MITQDRLKHYPGEVKKCRTLSTLARVHLREQSRASRFARANSRKHTYTSKFARAHLQEKAPRSRLHEQARTKERACTTTLARASSQEHTYRRKPKQENKHNILKLIFALTRMSTLASEQTRASRFEQTRASIDLHEQIRTSALAGENSAITLA